MSLNTHLNYLSVDNSLKVCISYSSWVIKKRFIYIFSEYYVRFVCTVSRLKKLFDTSHTSLHIDYQVLVLLVLNLFYIKCKKMGNNPYIIACAFLYIWWYFESYLHIWTFMDELPINVLQNHCYQLNGAPAHSSQELTKELNQMFEDRWIGRNGALHCVHVAFQKLLVEKKSRVLHHNRSDVELTHVWLKIVCIIAIFRVY